jgi:hypothetical protein
LLAAFVVDIVVVVITVAKVFRLSIDEFQWKKRNCDDLSAATCTSVRKARPNETSSWLKRFDRFSFRFFRSINRNDRHSDERDYSSTYMWWPRASVHRTTCPFNQCIFSAEQFIHSLTIFTMSEILKPGQRYPTPTPGHRDRGKSMEGGDEWW